MKNVYLVTVDTCASYGCNLELVGIFENLDAANETIEKMSKNKKLDRLCFDVTEVQLNSTYSIDDDDYVEGSNNHPWYSGDVDDVVVLGYYIE